MENLRNFGKLEKFWKTWEILENFRNFGKFEKFWKIWEILENLRNFRKLEIFWKIFNSFRFFTLDFYNQIDTFSKLVDDDGEDGNKM